MNWVFGVFLRTNFVADVPPYVTIDNFFASVSSYTEYMMSEFKMATSNVLLTKRNAMENQYYNEGSCSIRKNGNKSLII